MNYRTVFDIADAGYKGWTFPAFGLILVGIGVVLVVVRKHLSGWWSQRPGAGAAFSVCFLGFAVLWTITSFLFTYRDYSSLASAERSGHVQVAEGRVSDFKAMPITGHAMEHFCVGSKCFEYSDYVITGGFNNTSSHGGPIKQDLPVRVTFVGNEIVKLEVGQ